MGLTTFGITAAPKITDAALEVLTKHKDLTWINLDRCSSLTKAGVAKLRTALPKAQVIDPWRLGIPGLGTASPKVLALLLHV